MFFDFQCKWPLSPYFFFWSIEELSEIDWKGWRGVEKSEPCFWRKIMFCPTKNRIFIFLVLLARLILEYFNGLLF